MVFVLKFSYFCKSGNKVQQMKKKKLITHNQEYKLPQTVNEVEVMVVVWALLFAKDIGTSSIILKGDSKVVFNALISENTSFASYGHHIDEEKILAESFVKVVFFHTKRQENYVTHNFAKHVRHVSYFSV